jgi:hypothetical protein
LVTTTALQQESESRFLSGIASAAMQNGLGLFKCGWNPLNSVNSLNSSELCLGLVYSPDAEPHSCYTPDCDKM